MRSGRAEGKRRGWRAGTALLPFVLIGATCAGPGSPDQEAAEPAADGGGIDIGGLDDLGVAFVTDVIVEPPIAPPGHDVRISVEGHAPEATVRVTHGDEEIGATLDAAAQAVVTLPADAALGLHRVRVEHDGQVVGVGELRVADGAGVWIRADRRFAAPDDVVTLRVSSAGVPLDAPAILVAPPEAAEWDDDLDGEDDWWGEDGGGEVLDGDELDMDRLGEQLDELREQLQDDFRELEEQLQRSPDELDPFDLDDLDDGGEGAAMFRVSESGGVIPIAPTGLASGQLPTLGDLVGRPITVPGHLAALGGLRVAVARDLQQMMAVDGGPAVWSNAAPLEACDQLGELAGRVEAPSVVSAISLDVGLRVASVQTDGDYRLEAGPGRVLVSTTPVEGTDELGEPEVVEVTCGAVTTFAAAPSAQPRLVQASTSAVPLAQAGGGGGDRCRQVFVMTQAIGDMRAGFERAVHAFMSPTFTQGLPRASVMDTFSVRAVLQHEANLQLLGGESDVDLADLAGSMNADLLVALRVTSRSDGFELDARVIRMRDTARVASGTLAGLDEGGAIRSPLLDELVAAARIAEICGEVEPSELSVAPGESGDATLRVTDLGGQGADGAEVSVDADPECGDLLPPDGQREVAGDTLELVFEATAREAEECVDELQFHAEWPDGDPPTVETNPFRDQMDLTVRVGGRFKIEMDFEIDPETLLDAGVPLFFGLDARFEARNCDGGGILGLWEGELDIGGGFAGPFVGQADWEGAIPTSFMLPENGGPFAVPGMSELGLVGDYYVDGDVLVLTSSGYPWMVGEIQTLGEDEPC